MDPAGDEAAHASGRDGDRSRPVEQIVAEHPELIAPETGLDQVAGIDIYRFCDPVMAGHLASVTADQDRAAGAAYLEQALGRAEHLPVWIATLTEMLWMTAGARARTAAWQASCAARLDEPDRGERLLALARNLREIANSRAMPRWLAQFEGDVDLDEVANRGLDLVDGPRVKAELLLARAQVHARSHGADFASLDDLQEAVACARLAGEREQLVVMLAEYGRAVAKQSLGEGREALAEAVALSKGLNSRVEPRTRRAAYLARLQFAVNTMDSGAIVAGADLLAQLCNAEIPTELAMIRAMAWHYYAQASAALGQLDRARKALTACLAGCSAAHEDSTSPGWRAYAQAESACLEARYGASEVNLSRERAAQIADRARTACALARAEHEACPTLPPITDVLAADALTYLARIEPGFATLALAILDESVERSLELPARPRIAALTARARAKLALNQGQDAQADIGEAVALLDEHGGYLPALRTEDVLLIAARTAYATGDRERALSVIRTAAEVVARKRDALPPAAIAGFDAEPVNQAVALTYHLCAGPTDRG